MAPREIAGGTDEADLASAFRDSARELLERSRTIDRLRALRSSGRELDRAVWTEIARAGWPAILVPERAGGLGLGLGEMAAVVEEVGRHLLPEPFVWVGVHAVTCLSRLAPTPRVTELLKSIAEGKIVIGVAWQEEARQTEPGAALSLRAKCVGGTYRLRGTKKWAHPASDADGWLVLAQGDTDAVLLFVARDQAGLTIERDERVDGSVAATLHFDEAKVPEAAALASGAEVLEAIAQANTVMRAMLGVELFGVASTAFDMTAGHLKTRVQFGKPIGTNQALQHRLVDAYIQLRLAASVIREFLSLGPEADMAAVACRVKARCSEAALHVTRLALQFHGAIGYTDEYPLGFFWKRALNLSTLFGSAEDLLVRASSVGPPGKRGASCKAAHRPQDDEREFRREIRAFLQEHYPEALRHPPRRLRLHEVRDWYATLSKKGWLCPAWPKKYGGMELPPGKLLAFIEEFETYGVARLPDQGILNLGPILIAYGTDEQRQEYLPKILSGEHIWCQGYSEPNAGSDLASLRLEAEIADQDFILNGQKVWTTLAHDATHIFLLARTDKTVKKQEGISFILADLKTPGITIRPIRNMAGDEEFCEVFFDNVRVPRRNLVGRINQGWTIAKALLGFERLFVGGPSTIQHALEVLRALGHAGGGFARPDFVRRFARFEADVRDHCALYTEFADIVRRGEQLPASVSILKISATETYVRICAYLVEAAGEYGGSKGIVAVGGSQLNLTAPLLHAAITPIYGGTNEIQRNIVARNVLGLPV